MKDPTFHKVIIEDNVAKAIMQWKVQKQFLEREFVTLFKFNLDELKLRAGYADSLLIRTILSPVCNPARSDGVPGIGEITVIYPSKILNSIPIPSNSPSNCSLISSNCSEEI